MHAPPTESIDAVCLDVGGVLTLPPIGARLVSEGRADPRTVLLAHHRAAAAQDAVAGTGGDALDGPGAGRDAYHRALADELGVSAGEVESATGPWILAVPGAADALREITRMVPVAIVSNSDGTVARQLRDMGLCQVGPGPLPAVRIVVDSAEVGVRKPDPAIFAPALDALGVAPGRVAHVGDTVAFDVTAATAAGLVPVHLDAAGGCRGDHLHLRTLSELTRLLSP